MCAETRLVKSIDSGHTPPWGKEAIHLSQCNGLIRVRGMHKRGMMGSSSSQSRSRCYPEDAAAGEMSHLYPIHYLSGAGVRELGKHKNSSAFRRSAQLLGTVSVGPKSNRYIPRNSLAPVNLVCTIRWADYTRGLPFLCSVSSLETFINLMLTPENPARASTYISSP